MTTTADILEPAATVGQRTDRFRFDLLDRHLAVIGQLTPTVEQGPSIRASIESTVMRQLDGIEFVQGELADVDVRSERVQPVCVLQNGDEFPLGVYLFGEHNFMRSTRSDIWRPVLYDQALILDQPNEQTASIDTGVELQILFTRIAEEVGVMHVHLDSGHVVAGAPMAWPAGTSRYQILSELAEKMGCLRPYFDAMGVLTCRVAPDPTTTVGDYTYGPGRIEADTLVETNDSYRAPNVYIVIGTGHPTPVYASYWIPASAPHSIANRGYVVSETIDSPGVENYGQAYAAAQAAAVMDSRSWQRVSFTSPLDPRMDLFSFVNYDGGVYLETGFSMQLRSGGEHTHSLARLWQ